MHKGEETNPPSRKIPNSLSKPKWLPYFYLTINKMLHTFHYGTYVNQTGIQYQITFNNLGAKLYQVGRQLWSPLKDSFKLFLQERAGNREEWKVRRKGPEAWIQPWHIRALTDWPAWWKRHVSLVKPAGCPSSPVEDRGCVYVFTRRSPTPLQVRRFQIISSLPFLHSTESTSNRNHKSKLYGRIMY